MVDIGGYSLHINCSGEGKPAVILEPGLGWTSLEWTLVQQGVEKFTKVCSYDRAGYGWSDSASAPRTSLQLVQEMHELLIKAQIPPPYILVGHSFGGINARLFASLYPEEVMGLVLVDPSHENQFNLLPEGSKPSSDRLKEWILARTGILRWELDFNDQPPFVRKFPEPIQRMRLAKLAAAKQAMAVADEMDALEESFKQMKEAPQSLGAKPLIVITAAKFIELEMPDIPEEEKNNIRKTLQVMKDLHKELASLSSNGKHIIAEDSDHLVPVNQPDIIIHAIQEIVGTARH